ncbi:hypothetical protein KUCAC02_020542 [Chaenocephalus aceratus]|nr:hypothetical protein KUCAC02_020542 [Chaenocephalus aceratus]
MASCPILFPLLLGETPADGLSSGFSGERLSQTSPRQPTTEYFHCDPDHLTPALPSSTGVKVKETAAPSLWVCMSGKSRFASSFPSGFLFCGQRACQYDMVGPEGIVESHQITRDGKAGASEAVDCKWYIRAPPRSKIYLRFLDYEMANSNECKRNSWLCTTVAVRWRT